MKRLFLIILLLALCSQARAGWVVLGRPGPGEQWLQRWYQTDWEHGVPGGGEWGTRETAEYWRRYDAERLPTWQFRVKHVGLQTVPNHSTPRGN